MTIDQNMAEERDFAFFYEILEAFREAVPVHIEGKGMAEATDVHKFSDAMHIFLRIFDAFANPFFADLVKKDVQGNITVRSFVHNW